MLNNINIPKKIGNPSIYQINEKNIVEIQLYEKRGKNFYDVNFNNNGNVIFLVRFDKEDNRISVSYNNGKIMLYYENFNREKQELLISDILALYSIIDDTFYSCTCEEALNIFDKTLNVDGLINPNKNLIRTDIEKKYKRK